MEAIIINKIFIGEQLIKHLKECFQTIIQIIYLKLINKVDQLPEIYPMIFHKDKLHINNSLF